jgi:methyl-accepting chemotaxis protein
MLNNLKIRTKMFAAFIGLVFIGLLIGLIGYRGMTSSGRAQNTMATVFVPSLKYISDIMYNQSEIKANEYILLNNSFSIEDRNYFADMIEIRLQDLEAAKQKFDSLPKAGEDQALWKTYLADYEKWKQKHDAYIQYVKERSALMDQGVNNTDLRCKALDSKILDYYNNEVAPSFFPCETAGQKISAGQVSNATTANMAAARNTGSATVLLVIVISAGFVFALFVGIWISSNISAIIRSIVDQTKEIVDSTLNGKLDLRADTDKTNFEFRAITSGLNDTLDSLVHPLKMSAEYIERISRGDMPSKVTEEYKGDFNDIKNNLNLLIETTNDITEKAKLIARGDLTVELNKRSEKDELIQSLSDMVSSVAKVVSDFRAASENISGSSQEMSSTAQQMSQGATEQASSAEEVSSAMEQMAANIMQNTENAQQAQNIALNAAEGISKAAEAAQATTRNIEEIADKVSIIGEIARQTNILALNAAVEAARAGEHGRGFAVVAAEVRKLAERSQLSAVEIDSLTKTSVRATEDASKLMAAIVPEITKTAKFVQEIAAASAEQNSGADQVNSAIQQLNQITQQNAAASEEVATSSEVLSGQANQLLETVRFFKLSGDSATRLKDRLDHVLAKNVKVGTNSAKNKQYSQTLQYKKAGMLANIGKYDHTNGDFEKF